MVYRARNINGFLSLIWHNPSVYQKWEHMADYNTFIKNFPHVLYGLEPRLPKIHLIYMIAHGVYQKK